MDSEHLWLWLALPGWLLLAAIVARAILRGRAEKAEAPTLGLAEAVERLAKLDLVEVVARAERLELAAVLAREQAVAALAAMAEPDKAAVMRLATVMTTPTPTANGAGMGKVTEKAIGLTTDGRSIWQDEGTEDS